jgi:hypothetical protein
MDNLHKPYVIVVDWCCICKRFKASVDHLFLHCEIASALWSAIFSHTGVTWAMLRRAVDLFTYWRGLRGNHQSATVWKMVPSCLLWSSWKKINDRSFEDCNRTMVDLRSFFFNTLFH